MYPFVSHTWNPIKGRCLHDCPYCYVKSSRAKRYYEGEPYLSEKELKVNLGENNYIFVGSMTDMWGDWIPSEWIAKILMHCLEYQGNKYLFQSKNPKRFMDFKNCFSPKAILGTTIEGLEPFDFFTDNGEQCKRYFRAMIMRQVRQQNPDIEIMISVEPIMRFMLSEMLSLFKEIKPSFVVIGADSKGHNLDEPPAENIKLLITELEKFTKVICKKNLDRLL